MIAGVNGELMGLNAIVLRKKARLTNCYKCGPANSLWSNEPILLPLLCFTTTEKDKMTQMGVRKNDKGKWVLPDGREVLPKSVAMRVLWRFHEQTHWGTQALVD